MVGLKTLMSPALFGFPNVVSNYRRVMAISCNHGNRANADALAAVLLFRDSFRGQLRYG